MTYEEFSNINEPHATWQSITGKVITAQVHESGDEIEYYDIQFEVDNKGVHHDRFIDPNRPTGCIPADEVVIFESKKA